MSLASSLKRLRGLSAAERRVLAAALVLLPLAETGLRTMGLRRTQALLLRAGRGIPLARGLEPARIARIVEAAARRGPYRAKCLPRSLALQSLLASSGAGTELHFGVRKSGARLEAHAWVEHEGVALLEPEGLRGRYRAFARPVDPRRSPT
jgi:hypothetical protein